MKIIIAPNKYNKLNNDICLFLAGGITNCQNWQDHLIKMLNEENDNLIVFNPRRKNFPINDPTASFEQIKWEFDYLEQCDIFSMYFDGPTQSDQPICFYELGRNIERMKNKYPNDWNKRIVISVNSQFKRAEDVVIQTMLATESKVSINASNDFNELNTMHFNKIKDAYKYCESLIE
jgi:hypothetical protein